MKKPDLPTPQRRPAFLFARPNLFVEWVKSHLAHGNSLEITPIEGSVPPNFNVTIFPKEHFVYREICTRARSSADLGAYVRTYEPITLLGQGSLTTRAIDEALEAGFDVFLVAEKEDSDDSPGYYTLITTIADNT